MYSLLRLISCLLLAILLVSCTTSGRQSIDGDIVVESRNRFPAWQLENSREFEAINVLLSEVDSLIENNSLDAAEDKLERILRVKSGYAPAWSRLSWVALEKGSAKRAVQMAKRSNSFAHGNNQLQSLNWSFIRDASHVLQDEDTYLRAGQKIDSLQKF